MEIFCLGLYYPYNEYKGADQLCKAICALFSHREKSVFSHDAAHMILYQMLNAGIHFYRLKMSMQNCKSMKTRGPMVL